MRPRLDGVIFDVDGTLTSTNELIFSTFNYIADKYTGRTRTPREIIALFGPPEEGAILNIVGEERLDEAMKDLYAYYADNHRAMAALHPGIEEALTVLSEKGVTLAVFTGKGRRTAMITLEALGIDKHFHVVMSGSDVRCHKPDPEGIRKILEICSLDPEGVVMVGDAVADVRASRAAGVRSAAVLWDSYDPEAVLAAAPDLVFRRVDEMTSWFRGA
jgi:HAD superfamily hydrolase (TIGR01549 family)